MRRLLSLIGISLALAAAADAKGPIDDWAGVYKVRSMVELVDGPPQSVEDEMDIIRIDAARAYVELHLNFYNGHTCGWGEVMTQEGGRLIYRSPDEKYYGGQCVMSLSRDDNLLEPGIVIHDQDRGCRKMTCGVRGGYEGAKFLDSARSTARSDMETARGLMGYLEALKAAGLPLPP